MGVIWQDLHFAVRVLLKQPSFTFAAIITLALGIGANSAIFSVVNGVLLRPLPYPEPERVVQLWETFKPRGLSNVDLVSSHLSAPNFVDWRDQSDVFSAMCAYAPGDFSLQEGGRPERVAGLYATVGFFEVLGVAPLLGHGFVEGDDTAGRNNVVVLSHRLWQARFGGDPAIVGKSIKLNDHSHTVIGVMPASFRFTPGRFFLSNASDILVPLTFSESEFVNRDGGHNYFGLARLKPHVSLEQAQAQIRTIAAGIAEKYPDMQAGRGAKLIAYQDELTKDTRPTLLILLGAVSFVLLIACMNVANLLLVKATSRRRETAIRAALGASRWQLIRQFLVESVLLSLVGGTVGLLFSLWGTSALIRLATSFLPRAAEVSLDWRVVSFTFGLAVLTGLIFGLAPARHAAKANVQEALKEDGNSGVGPRSRWLRNILVVAETSAALVLLIGAGLLVKTFLDLSRVDVGFQTENLLTFKASLSNKHNRQTAMNFYQATANQIAALPGVQAVGAINWLPIEAWGINGPFQVEGQETLTQAQSPRAEWRSVSPDYFRAMNIPLRAGRFFNARDDNKVDLVLIINQTLAERYFPSQDPLGRRLYLRGVWGRIVGVVGDIKQSGLARPVRPEIYMAYPQFLQVTYSFVVRASVESAALTNAIRRTIQRIDPDQPIYDVRTMDEVIGESLAEQRLSMVLLGIFAAVALLLALLGTYTVVSYTVTQSQRTIGIRMALGAQPKQIFKRVVGEGMLLTLAGIFIGLIAAIGLTRLLSSLLFGLSATDPMTFGVVSVLLALAALFACYFPARRATKVDPMVALRYE